MSLCTKWLKSLNPTSRQRKPTGQRERRLGLEALEERAVPATLQLVNGVLTYTAADGVANRLEVSASAATYTFSDSAEVISVVGVAGATGSGTNTVTLPASAVPPAGVAVNLGDINDAMTLHSSLHSVSVDTGADDDTIDIRTTAAGTRTTVNGGTGQDAFRVGSATNTLDGILGALTIDGGANYMNFLDHLQLMDQGSSARGYTFRADQRLARTGNVMIAYAGLERMTLHAGAFADSVSVLATSAGTPLVLNMGDGNDAVTLGSPGASLAKLAAPVTVNGDAGIDTVTLNDQASATTNAYGVFADGVSYDNFAGPRLVTYAGAERLTLRAGQGHDHVDVFATPAQMAVALQGGAGDDAFTIQPGQAGSVTLDGQAGTDTLGYYAHTTGVRVNLALGTATDALGGVGGIEVVNGGAGNDILVGNDQSNVLWGGEGRDILIGRAGADSIFAEGGDDILVGDGTTHDTSAVRLEDLTREWSRTYLHGGLLTRYNTRVHHLLGVTPGGLNGTTLLTPAQIVSDGAADSLQGGADQDWFFTTGTDHVVDLTLRERVNAAPPAPAVVGNVTVTLLDGDLYINEEAYSDGLRHGVRVSRLANGNILVTGLNPTDSDDPIQTLINGRASMEFEVTGSLSVDLGGGADLLVMDDSAGLSPQFADAVIDTGADGAGDKVIIWGLHTTTGSLIINTGGGNDWVFLSGSTVGDGYGADQLFVNTGAGSDQVTVKNGTHINGSVDIQTYTEMSEDDMDGVYFDTGAFVLLDVHARTGGGDDMITVALEGAPIYFASLVVGGSLTIDTGTGNDEAYLRGMHVYGDFSLSTGAGADMVTMDFRRILLGDGSYFLPRIEGDLVIQTYDSLEETDRDEVSTLSAAVLGSLAARLGGGDDYFSMTGIDLAFIGNDLDVHMGAGNDEAEVSAFVMDHLMMWMGEGDDVLGLGRTGAYRLIADGNAGNDSFTKTSQTRAQYLDLFGWETINPHG